MLSALQLGDGQNIGTRHGTIALDCSVRKTRHGHYVISTTDFFFPLVDSPFMQGRIGAANVLSDLYALGVHDGHVDFVLMLLAACRAMPEPVRTICTRQMMEGFQHACDEAQTVITGGQTVVNPWPIIGGVATSIVSDENEFIRSDHAQVGDVVVLTKPLGTQVAANVHQWRRSKNPHRLWTKCLHETDITNDRAETMMHVAVNSMAKLNRHASRLLLTHGAHACTDVTGFGILGHAQNLASNQIQDVAIEIHTLPCIADTMLVNDQVFNFRLRKGYSAETSGGLLICLPEESVQAFQSDLQQAETEAEAEAENEDAEGSAAASWIIGRVVADPNRLARIVDNVEIVEV